MVQRHSGKLDAAPDEDNPGISEQGLEATADQQEPAEEHEIPLSPGPAETEENPENSQPALRSSDGECKPTRRFHDYVMK